MKENVNYFTIRPEDLEEVVKFPFRPFAKARWTIDSVKKQIDKFNKEYVYFISITLEPIRRKNNDRFNNETFEVVLQSNQILKIDTLGINKLKLKVSKLARAFRIKTKHLDGDLRELYKYKEVLKIDEDRVSIILVSKKNRLQLENSLLLGYKENEGFRFYLNGNIKVNDEHLKIINSLKFFPASEWYIKNFERVGE